MWFFSADWHLGHSNIIKYCRRPFLTREEEGLIGMADRGSIPGTEVRISQESTDRMTDTIIDSTNAVVDRNDTLVIAGDFCSWAKSSRYSLAKQYRDRIKCRNVIIVWGNHDDRRDLAPIFNSAYDEYLFKVDGQYIFVNHYPCRSWDRAHHGSWMLYGHVHNLLWEEDNGGIMPWQKQVFTNGFQTILETFGIDNDSGRRDEAVRQLLDVVASVNGIDLTVDVGVDNVREGVPFGTPWSMPDLREHFAQKMDRWNARSDAIRMLRPVSTLKSGNSNAHPKF